MPEIIQQWQVIGKPHPRLLEDGVFQNAKRIGITSLQSYLLWSEIEKKKGKIDFSSYDIVVEKIKKNNFKWVPFLILGPGYATPQWFKDSQESVVFQCLEHKKESENQSIWNPNLPRCIDKFLSSVARRYIQSGVLESIVLGISGNWGEAIFPAGGYFLGKFHSHLGFWCGDQFARKSFIDFGLRKYPSLEVLNTAWGTNFQKVSEISFPSLPGKRKSEIGSYFLNFFCKKPSWLKKWLKLPFNYFLNREKRAFVFSETGFSPPQIKNSAQYQRWMDFVGWYSDSMNKWVELWLRISRKYFPDTKIYLATGGTNNPVLGADFSRQTKIAAKYGAGIRITNQTNDYSQSFILSRLVSSAARFYNSYFTTEEEAVLQTAQGVTMRIFDAISSGADGFYCKNIIDIGEIPCLKRGRPTGLPLPGAGSLEKNLPYFPSGNPIIGTAVFFPNTSVIFKPALIASLYNQCAKLRDVLDVDLIDENMIKDGVLGHYQYLLVLEGEMPKELSQIIKDWVGSGGVLTSNPEEIHNEIDEEYDKVYAARFSDKILYYNANNKKVVKKVAFLEKNVEIEPNSISEIKI